MFWKLLSLQSNYGTSAAHHKNHKSSKSLRHKTDNSHTVKQNKAAQVSQGIWAIFVVFSTADNKLILCNILLFLSQHDLQFAENDVRNVVFFKAIADLMYLCYVLKCLNCETRSNSDFTPASFFSLPSLFL